MYKIIFTFLLCFSCSLFGAETLQYCVPVAKFDLNPFREIKDGKELAFLILLSPYISPNPNDHAILEAYEFSPDGKTFTGKINSNTRWPDGSPLSSKEAALGIAKGFLFRPIGERVKVVGSEALHQKDTCPGIKIIDEKTFELKFESSIENLTGAVREALSAGSRHNRVWPVRKSNQSPQLEFIAKNPEVQSDESPTLAAEGKKILFAAASKCTSADFTLYPDLIKADLNAYTKKRNNKPQAITLQLNTTALNLKVRKALASWVRKAFSTLPKTADIEGTPSFFLEGEPGYKMNSSWDEKNNLKLLKGTPLKLGVEIPAFKAILAEAAKQDDLDLTLLDFPLKDGSAHGQVLSSGIHDGRQIILQDILKWNFAGDFLKSAPKTIESLKSIAKRSASTVPPDTSTLQKFENAAKKEYSLIPIGRRYVSAYSKKNLAIHLDWTTSGELIFIK